MKLPEPLELSDHKVSSLMTALSPPISDMQQILPLLESESEAEAMGRLIATVDYMKARLDLALEQIARDQKYLDKTYPKTKAQKLAGAVLDEWPDEIYRKYGTKVLAVCEEALCLRRKLDQLTGVTNGKQNKRKSRNKSNRNRQHS